MTYEEEKKFKREIAGLQEECGTSEPPSERWILLLIARILVSALADGTGR